MSTTVKAVRQPPLILFADSSRMIALCPMKPSEAQTYWELLYSLDSDRWTRLSKTDLAKRLAMHRPTASRAVDQLVERGLVCAKPHGLYRLSLFAGWKGSAVAYRDALQERADEVELGFGWHASRAVTSPQIDVDGSEAWQYYIERLGDLGAGLAERPATDWEAEQIDDESVPTPPAQRFETHHEAFMRRLQDEDATAALYTLMAEEKPQTMTDWEWAEFVLQFPAGSNIIALREEAECYDSEMDLAAFARGVWNRHAGDRRPPWSQ